MQKHSVQVKVNGVTYVREVEARRLLADFIRDDLGLKGTHVGCEQGQCGCCTVLINGESIKSCLMLAVQADGCEITTIEGLTREGKLHPLQESFWENHGLQCGFCTPGQLMNALYLLKNNPDPSEVEIREGIAGNVCRCTGYVNIVKAIKGAAVKMRQETA
ncbi:MAG: (2Fe-2S)-binding protein [Desulfobacterales bacterium]|nr:(2Fe-2S)-binding protein [Desulfobacterales bacterium]